MNWRRMRVLVLLAETLVLLALATTLWSLHHDQAAGQGPDGLNNLFQMPLALPWMLVVPPSGSWVGDAWVDAGLGTFNVAILATAVFLDGRSRRQPTSS